MNRPTDKMEEQAWIEQYLAGSMTPAEQATVEAEIETDPDFANEVAQLKRAQDRLAEVFLAQRARATIHRLQQRETAKIRPLPYLMGLAAACLALIAYLSLSPVQFPDSENDFSVTRNLNGTTNRPATHQYAFEQFFDGQAHILEGDYALAVTNFEHVLGVVGIRPYFREAAQWHLAVAYLKSGQPQRAGHIYNQFTDCIDCEYPISLVNRWRIWWQINWAKWLA